MKKKIFGVALIAAMSVAASWNFNQSKNEVELSDIALTNIQALALGESGGNNCSTTNNGPYCGEYTNSSGYRVYVYYP